MINHPNLGRKRRATARAAAAIGHNHEADYAALLASVQASFAAVAGGPLFCTAATGLPEAYLSRLGGERHIHECSACKRFIETFGTLASIGEDGRLRSAMWQIGPDFYAPALTAMRKAVEAARVTGPFFSAEAVWGTPSTGAWTHFSVMPQRAYRRGALTAGQAMAAKREDFRTVAAALADFKPELLAEAMRLLEADALARSERFIGPVQWLQQLHEDRAVVKGPARDNILWRAIATAPDGYCHPRASVVGSLLEDIAAGMPFAEVKARFDAKLHPLRYQRPQAAPSVQTIARAERLVEELGIAPALDRRFARLDDLTAIWRPAPNNEKKAEGGGVFAHLKPKSGGAIDPLVVPAQTMTWEKFARVELPEAEAIELYVPQGLSNFVALTTAANADAPPILKWDQSSRRNPVAWYVYHGGSTPAQFSVVPGWCVVTGITELPPMWGEPKMPFLGEGIILLLSGAIDTRDAGNALFPECLKDDLHGVRSVIESYSRRAKLAGREDASACGMDLRKGAKWPGYLVRVHSKGRHNDYRLDRWD